MAKRPRVRDTLFVRVPGAVVAAGATIVLAVAPASAAPERDTLLRPGIGAGKLRLGMTLTQVRAVLGRPLRVQFRRPAGFRGEYVQYVWGLDAAWEVGFVGRDAADSRAVLVDTSRPERTRGGVGVGSTHRTLQRRLGARCYRERVGAAIYAPHRDFVVCYLGNEGKGPITRFGLLTECTLPRDRYSVECPSDKRRYRAGDVTIVSVVGQRILAGPCGFERAHTERCD